MNSTPVPASLSSPGTSSAEPTRIEGGRPPASRWPTASLSGLGRAARGLGAALVMATTACAAPEQWLQYHTSTEGQGYRWLELTTNAPTGVALPKLNPAPFFARWTTPLDPSGGRWLCFDRTRKSGPWNRLFIDRNGDGRLDDEAPIDAPTVDPYSANFDPTRLVFKGEDGPLIYHLVLRFMNYGQNDVRLLAASGGYYDGKVELGGKKRVVRLLDANVNGTFNDLAARPQDCDRIVVEGDRVGERFLGQLLEVGDQFYTLDVARDGAFIKVQPAKDVALGQVRVPETLSEFIAVGTPGQFVRKPAQGAFTLPVGRYHVQSWTLDRKDDKGSDWQLSGSGATDFGSFEVAQDRPVTLDVGEPVLAALTVTETKGGASFGLRLKGRLGESVDIQKGGQRPRAPQLCLASATSAFRATNTFEYG
jgi:hypothetical protein